MKLNKGLVMSAKEAMLLVTLIEQILIIMPQCACASPDLCIQCMWQTIKSGQGIMYMCVVVHSAQHRGIGTTGAFIYHIVLVAYNFESRIHKVISEHPSNCLQGSDFYAVSTSHFSYQWYSKYTLQLVPLPLLCDDTMMKFIPYKWKVWVKCLYSLDWTTGLE